MTAAQDQVIRVTTAEELHSALTTAQGGEVIELAAGHYGELSLWDVQFPNIKFPETVTVRSEDPADMAVFSGMKLSGVENLVFDRIEVDFVPDENTYKISGAVQLKNVADVTFKNSVLEGGPAVNGVPQETTVDQGLDATGNVLGLPTGRAFNITDSTGVTLENNDISMFAEGILFISSDDLQIVGNEVYNLRDTPLKGANLDNVLVDGNYFHDFTPWNLGGAGDHGDLIHFWTDLRYQDTPSQNFTVTNNYFSEGAGASLLGVYFDDNQNYLGFENVLIENNVIQNGDMQGIRLERVDGGTIRNNTLVQSSGDENDAPGVVLTLGTENITIEDNILGIVHVDPDPDRGISPEQAATISQTNNLTVQRHDPYAENYYAEIFVNAMTRGAGLDDLQALPEGLVAEMGVGADATRFDTTPDSLTALIIPLQDERDGDHYTFNAGLSAGPNGLTGPDGATYHWDFGDGSAATGIAIEHVFPGPGTYDVVLTVTQADGTSDTTNATARVPDTMLLEIDFGTNGPIDESSYQSAVDYDPLLAEIVDGSDGDGYHLTDDNWFQVRKADAGQIYSLHEMSLSFAIKRDSADDGTGDIIRVHGDWRVILEESGELTFDFHNADDEHFVLTTTAADLNDTDWHAVSVVYDSIEGMARIYVDGDLAGEGAMSGRTPPQGVGGFAIGNPFGANYNGLIDQIEMRSEALDANAVMDLHDDLAGLATGVNEIAFDTNYWLTFDDKIPEGDEVELRGDATIAAQGDNNVLTLDGDADYVDVGRLDDIADAAQLTIALDFQRDDAGDTGFTRLLWNHTKYGIELNGTELAFVVGLEGGFIKRFKVKDVAVDDTDWHQIALVMDETTGQVSGYLDGVEILSVTLDNLSFSGSNRWDATIGGTAWDSSTTLDGQIDNVAFVDDVLDAAALASLTAVHDGSAAVEPEVVAQTNTDATPGGAPLAPIGVLADARTMDGALQADDQTKIGVTGDAGVTIRAINPWTALGRELDLAADGSSQGYVVAETGLTAEIGGQTVEASRWSLQYNQADRDGPALSATALETTLQLGSVVTHADIMVGTEQGDRMYAHADGVQFDGAGGDDLLVGQAGDDMLMGGAGNDRLIGNGGSDQFWGGEGEDLFILRTGDGADVIHDLEAGDSLVLRDFGFESRDAVLDALVGDDDRGVFLHLGGADGVYLADHNAQSLEEIDFLL